MILNKLYDYQEFFNPQTQQLFGEIKEFSKKIHLLFHELKWFEYAHALLYSQHRYPCKVLDVGSAQSLFPFVLAYYRYDVTTLDLEFTKFRQEEGKKFGITALTGDIREEFPELREQFQLITCLSVIEHIDDDTKAVLNLAKYLEPGGVLFLSTDFYKDYIEYPDANRILVTDRPKGSHALSRVYDEQHFMERVILPLEQAGLKRVGETNYQNVDITDPSTYSVRRLYTFGIATLRKEV